MGLFASYSCFTWIGTGLKVKNALRLNHLQACLNAGVVIPPIRIRVYLDLELLRKISFAGSAPLVVARGGFSGLLPDSSFGAYTFALNTSVSNVILWCDVQLTKDGDGICFPYLRLDNSSDISLVTKAKPSTYDVNGVPLQGYFSIDFIVKDLAQVALTQGIYSRNPNFDGAYRVITVDAFKQLKLPGSWLNIQHDAFFSQHNLSMRNFVLGASKNVIINCISSPEVNFLRGIAKPFAPTKTKLIFRFLDQDETEPSTNQTCSSLLKNLTFIKTFASGILVPKAYIWPVDGNLYLQPHTSIVINAHKIRLEVFAADFANDFVLPTITVTIQLLNICHSLTMVTFQYSEYMLLLLLYGECALNGDSVLHTTECFAHIGKNALGRATPLVISHNGASGDYPGFTDIAYTKAISDGANVTDCNVQMSKDGMPFCLSSINLIDSTTVAQTVYSIRTTKVLVLQKNPGIFSFSLTWDEIQGLTPLISNPFTSYQLSRNLIQPANSRNPEFKNAGKLVSLFDFLALAQNATSLSGVIISIENALYLAANQGLSVTDAVLEALDKAGYNSKTAKKVMIQSSDSSVLPKFKGKNYELVYHVNEIISDILNSTILDIKNFSDSVLIGKKSSFKLHVYVELFRNEFVSQDWDFFSDPIVEINQFVTAATVDGLVTDFPQTAASYKMNPQVAFVVAVIVVIQYGVLSYVYAENRCLNSTNLSAFLSAVPPGGLLQSIATALPPAEPPAPVFTDADVSEPALPPAVKIVPSPAPSTTTASSPKTPSSVVPRITLSAFLSSLAMVVAALLLF
ncbi:hypothetical protein Ancab_025056 [Ancistrocladus abbreviatus]